MNTSFATLPVLQAAKSSSGSMISTIVMFGLIFVIFYFLIIRPQNKKQKEAQKMLEAIKKGDKVVTIGGIHGVVYAIKEGGTVVVKVDDDCKLEFTKSAIASVLNRDAPAEKVEKAGKADKAIADKSSAEKGEDSGK
jgi:preprotein translocase subunit YajC